MTDDPLPRWKRAAGMVLLGIVFGPFMFGGELVGPTGHVSPWQLASGVFGTAVWIGAATLLVGAWPPAF